MFAGRDIAFDPLTGLFSVIHHCTRRIRLQGDDGQRYRMVRKALQRNGVQADRDTESELLIEIHPDRFTLHAPHRPPVTVSTIEQLLLNI